MRIGIITILHESNTFIAQPTTKRQFEDNVWLTDPVAIEAHFRDSHHEVGGFFAGLREAAEAVEIVPLFAARALPSGTIEAATWSELVATMLESTRATMSSDQPLDGILVAPHGATVSEEFPDADGHWLSELRALVGPNVWLGGTLDLHANLSPKMVDACDFLTSYRTNPHLDQRDRGREAARIMVDAVAGRRQPKMRGAFPPLVIAIDRQDTAAPWLAEVYELAEQLRNDGLLSASLLLGFPYSDVHEMGAATIAVADGDEAEAEAAANRLAEALLARRELYRGQLIGIEEALDQCGALPGPVCLLDMGDNVGGGSAADGTLLAHALLKRQYRSFVCLYDAAAVQAATDAGVGAKVELSMGGKSDDQHGKPFVQTCEVLSLSDGKFTDPQPRHGGMSKFDQGPTAVVQVNAALTVMLTSRRMVPFSLQQLIAAGVEPTSYQVLVAKGVHAPLAAYREVCPSIVRVNTFGSTCADVHQLTYHHRRQPLFPFEPLSAD